MHRLKPFFYALFAFLAACSVSVGPGGALLLQFPPLADFITHLDLYAAGLLVVFEIFTRVVPSSRDSTVSGFFVRLLDSCLPNRAIGGGEFSTISHAYGHPV